MAFALSLPLSLNAMHACYRSGGGRAIASEAAAARPTARHLRGAIILAWEVGARRNGAWRHILGIFKLISDIGLIQRGDLALPLAMRAR